MGEGFKATMPLRPRLKKLQEASRRTSMSGFAVLGSSGSASTPTTLPLYHSVDVQFGGHMLVGHGNSSDDPRLCKPTPSGDKQIKVRTFPVDPTIAGHVLSVFH